MELTCSLRKVQGAPQILFTRHHSPVDGFLFSVSRENYVAASSRLDRMTDHIERPSIITRHIIRSCQPPSFTPSVTRPS